jgi:hypothetical protein
VEFDREVEDHRPGRGVDGALLSRRGCAVGEGAAERGVPWVGHPLGLWFERQPRVRDGLCPIPLARPVSQEWKSLTQIRSVITPPRKHRVSKRDRVPPVVKQVPLAR